MKGGADCPQAAADGSVVRQPLEDNRLHPYRIVSAQRSRLPLAFAAGLLAAGLSFSACGADAPEPAAAPDSGRVRRDLAYGPHPERNVLDLYLPEKTMTGPWPVVVWIHSGGWYTGGKGGGGAARALVARGYAVAAINYRFSQDAIFPAQIEDCQRAIRWLRAHAGEYGLDPTRFGAWGGSAGGHLAALLGTAPEAFPAPAEDPHRHLSAHVSAVCAHNPPTDLARWDALLDRWTTAPPSWLVLDDYIWAHGDGPYRVGNQLLARQADRIERAFVCGKALFVRWHEAPVIDFD